jgi:hypothetical protein
MGLNESSQKKRIIEIAGVFFAETKKSFSFLEDIGYQKPHMGFIESKVFCLIPYIEFVYAKGRRISVNYVPASLKYDKDDAITVSIKRMAPNSDSGFLFVDKYIADRKGELSEDFCSIPDQNMFLESLGKILVTYSQVLRNDLLGVITAVEWISGYDEELA